MPSAAPRSPRFADDAAPPVKASYERDFAERLLLLHAVTQDRLGSPWGNCLEACYATLLGVTLDDVPDPRDNCEADDGWSEAGTDSGAACATSTMADRRPWLADWLAEDHGIVAVTGSGESPPGVLLRKGAVPLFWIAHGPSPRGFPHAVVYSNRALLWDPHPSRKGLLRVERWSVLAPLGPLKGRILQGYVVPTTSVGRRVKTGSRLRVRR